MSILRLQSAAQLTSSRRLEPWNSAIEADAGTNRHLFGFEVLVGHVKGPVAQLPGIALALVPGGDDLA